MAANNSFAEDNNNDGYLDAPLSQHYFVQNVWKHNGPNSVSIFSFKAVVSTTLVEVLYTDKVLLRYGHTNYKPNAMKFGQNAVIS